MTTMEKLDFISSKINRMKKELTLPNTADEFRHIAQTANDLYSLLFGQASDRYKHNVVRDLKLREAEREKNEIYDFPTIVKALKSKDIEEVKEALILASSLFRQSLEVMELWQEYQQKEELF